MAGNFSLFFMSGSPVTCINALPTLNSNILNADAPKSKNAKVTLVYQHELPNVPGKSIKGVLVEYGPGGYSPGHTLPNPRLSTRRWSRWHWR